MSKKKKKQKAESIQPEQSKPSRQKTVFDNPRFWFWIILLLSVILRAIYYLQDSTKNPLFSQPVSDAGVYFEWGKAIASGQWSHNGVFYMAPLYPYILGVIFMVFGVSVNAAVIVQHIAGLFSLVLVYEITKKVFDDRAAVIAMILVALHAVVVFNESKILLTSFTLLFYLLSLYLLLYQKKEKANFPLSFVTGLMIGISVLQRPNILLFIPFVVIWFFILFKPAYKTALLSSILLVIGMLIPIAPVTMHNYNASGDFILLTSNTGVNFYYGANMDAAPTFTRRTAISDSIENEESKAKEIAEKELGRELGPKEVSDFWMAKGFDAIRQDVPKWLLYEAKKFYWILNSYEIANNYNIQFEGKQVPFLRVFFIPFGFICLFGIVGIWLAGFKNTKILLLNFYLLSTFLGLILFTVVSRFRVPLTVVLASFAGYGILEYFALIKRRNIDLQSSKKYLAATIIIILLAVPTMVPYRKASNPASSYHTLGVLAFRKGDYQEAIKYQELALQTFPEYTEAYNNLGSSYRFLGDFDKAIEMYDKASETNPKYPESRANAGLVYLEKKEYSKSIEKFQEALAIRPDYYKAKMNMAFAIYHQGDVNRAIQITEELIKAEPNDPAHNFNLGEMLRGIQDNEGAKKQYEIALSKDPNYQDARNALEKLR
jgi:tetratricopeptide (TPR) repeat protein